MVAGVLLVVSFAVMVAGAAVRQMLAVTNAKFGPTSDFTSIIRVVEEWAGVQVRG